MLLRRCLPACLVLPLLSLAWPVWSAAPPTPPFGPGSDPAAVSIDRRLIDASKSSSELMANLTHLCDAIGPRLTGSAALQRANEWAADKMRSYGLANVRLEPYTIPEGWQRGTATATLVEPLAGRPLTVASMGWYPGTKGKVRGEVVYLKAEKTAELEAYKGKLSGAMVLLTAPRQVARLDQLGKPTDPTRGPAGNFGRRSMSELQAFRKSLYAFLEKEGVAAVFQDAGKPLGLLTMTGSWGTGDRSSATNRIPTLFVAHQHYDLLYRLATRTTGPRPRLDLEVNNTFIPGPVKVFNTVGEIVGSEKPNEYVVVGAHLDSWDLAQGATDNGTGSSVVLEAARMISRSGVRPKRTIRFVLFSGEEQGLHGSKAFADKHKDDLARTSAALVHDTGTGRVKGIGTGGRPIHRAILERELKTLSEVGVSDFDAPTGGGSDHVSFSRLGVPGFMLVQDMSTYSYTHHTQADTLDAADEKNLIQGAQVMAVTAVRIANLNGLLPRLEQSPRRQ
ncbi:MAG: M20/M25/M40 family metallo-hydrolase [Gemmataceae bacterium]